MKTNTIIHKRKPKTEEQKREIGLSVSGENNGMYGKHHTKETREKMRVSRLGKDPWNKGKKSNKKSIIKTCSFCKIEFEARNKNKIFCSRICSGKNKKFKKLTEEHKSKIRESTIGRIFSEDTKKKIRVNTYNRIKNNYGQVFPSYNKKACEYFKKFDENNNTKGQYALYGGGEYYVKDLGYWLDYINFEKKLIIEWDEKHHYLPDGSLREKDVIRQREILSVFPDFVFDRIKEDIIEVLKCQ